LINIPYSPSFGKCHTKQPLTLCIFIGFSPSFEEYGWSIKAGCLVWDYNTMFQVLFLILGLLSIGFGLKDGENIQGTLLIKQNKADESTQEASFSNFAVTQR
jgi:hypothetical protein